MLKDIFASASLKDIVFVVMDQQVRYCDLLRGYGNAKTQAAAIVNTVFLDNCREMGVDTCGIYMIAHEKQTSPEDACGGLYLITPAKFTLPLFPKRTMDVYDEKVDGVSTFKTMLDQNAKKIILFAGFNLSECLSAAVSSTLDYKNYNVVVLKDGSADSNFYLNEDAVFKKLQKKGAQVCESHELLQYLNDIAPQI